MLDHMIETGTVIFENAWRSRAPIRARLGARRSDFFPGGREAEAGVMNPERASADGSAAVLALEALQTPCLVLDTARMDANIARMRSQLDRLGVAFRPHVKTAKSIEIARRMMGGVFGPATVSTLKEAQQLGAAGVRDILYAVGIAASKLERVATMRRSGIDLSVILDSLEQARAVCAASRSSPIPALIEIDCDGQRAGLQPEDPRVVEIARALHAGGAELRGVMTHAGGSYDCPGATALAKMAEQERVAVVTAAEGIRGASLPCPVVSVGSTPTALHARDLSAVTEVRAGVFVFFDLVMAGLGVCRVEDIAISVLATVTGHQREKGWTFVDAGWLAMSRDRGTSQQRIDQGYGLVCDVHGVPFGNLLLAGVNQEHGILRLREGVRTTPPQLPVGTLVRILPNHACATAAQFEEYQVVEGSGVVSRWPRFRGW